MRTMLLLALLLAAPLAVEAQKIYKHVAEDGTVTFSDEPLPDGQEVDLPPISVVETDGAQPLLEGRSQEREATADDDEPVRYVQLQIVSPEPESTWFAAEGPVQVSVSAGRPLAQGHQFRLFMDRRQIAETTNTTMSLENVVRGAHTLYVQVVDGRGRPLGVSDPVTFYLRQPSILMPGRQGAAGAGTGPGG